MASVSETTCVTAAAFDVTKESNLRAAEANLRAADNDLAEADRNARAANLILAACEADYDALRPILRVAASNAATYREADYNSARSSIRDAALAVIAAYDGVRSASHASCRAASAFADCEGKYYNALFAMKL